MVKPISPALRDRLEQLAALARTKGANLWDLLNQAGLLYTNDRQAAERARTLERAIEDLDALSVPQIIGSAYRAGNFTAGDMRRGLMEHLARLAEKERKGPNEV